MITEEQVRVDIHNLMALLMSHQQNTGEYLEPDDASVLNDIEQRWRVSPQPVAAPPANANDNPLVSAPPAGEEELVELDCYDAGLLPEGKYSDEWWRQVLRSTLAAAHEFYQEQVNDRLPKHDARVRDAALEEAAKMADPVDDVLAATIRGKVQP